MLSTLPIKFKLGPFGQSNMHYTLDFCPRPAMKETKEQMYHYKREAEGGFKSEDTGECLHCQHKYSKSLSWAENLNFPPKTVNNTFKFSAQDRDLEYLCWQCKNSPVSFEL